MLAVIEEIEILDQNTALVIVSYDGKLHTLELYADELTDFDAIDTISRALRRKLTAEQITADLIRQSFNLLQKAYGEA